MTCARLSDKYRTRWPFIVVPYTFGAIGLLGLLVIPHPQLPGLTYAWLFFIPAGLYPPVIVMAGWLGGNLAPTSKRAVCLLTTDTSCRQDVIACADRELDWNCVRNKPSKCRRLSRLQYLPGETGAEILAWLRVEPGFRLSSHLCDIRAEVCL